MNRDRRITREELKNAIHEAYISLKDNKGGRNADYILKEQNPFKLFVYADLDSRISRCAERDTASLTEKQIKSKILRIDKNRSRYYSFYTGQTWGDKDNYDLCINTTNTIIKDMVPVLAKIFE